MTQPQAERIANILLGVAAAGLAVYVLQDPRLRRTAWRLGRIGLSAAASWLLAEGRRTWIEAGSRAGLPAPGAPRL